MQRQIASVSPFLFPCISLCAGVRVCECVCVCGENNERASTFCGHVFFQSCVRFLTHSFAQWGHAATAVAYFWDLQQIPHIRLSPCSLLSLSTKKAGPVRQSDLVALTLNRPTQDHYPGNNCVQGICVNWKMWPRKRRAQLYPRLGQSGLPYGQKCTQLMESC